MKLISWNVNGLRAAIGKGFLDFFQAADADVVCLQETKLQPHQIELDLPGYQIFWNSAVKKGYSGTALFTRVPPLAVTYGIGIPEHDTEGRVITAEFDGFYLVNCYTPNAQQGLARIDYRMAWEDAFRAYLQGLDGKKPVILCGDLNVAHEEIDLKNPKANRGNAGFSDQERGKMTELLSAGFADTFRRLYPDVTGVYSWWSYRFRARDNNAGWRIDYFIVSERLMPRVADSQILTQVMGSDHCPVLLSLTE
ncbi:exodeoxyribonuclease III [Pseudoflavonifractor phocaeensis]|uniref:exodeoxyribonuclease III n=1 Tax=Pseudoflavonifractor phocaeensis TaxID=1870988 RepID=UPI00195C5BD9|nr:exodeoxyribonuclease III [Pseudoflavonifractor phocaeensis]MBM6938054.1 exodeoxyribonuclease III [Pseudoflavonifractor phocaeensis]